MRGFRSKAGRRCRSRGAQAAAGAGDAGHLDITSFHQVQEMEETFVEFLKLNESKNIMAVAGTPLTLAGLWVIFYHKMIYINLIPRCSSTCCPVLPVSCSSPPLSPSSPGLNSVSWVPDWPGQVPSTGGFSSRFLMFLTGKGRLQVQVNFLQDF